MTQITGRVRERAAGIDQRAAAPRRRGGRHRRDVRAVTDLELAAAARGAGEPAGQARPVLRPQVQAIRSAPSGPGRQVRGERGLAVPQVVP